MTHFNQRQFPRTSPLFDPAADDIIKSSKSAQRFASISGFIFGLVIGAGLTLIFVGLSR